MTEEPHAPESRRPRIVLGVCGGIAAYKAVEVCRLLVDAGAHVTPVLTSEATRFVGALTFSALASEPAQTSLWDEDTRTPVSARARTSSWWRRRRPTCWRVTPSGSPTTS
jgi:phosphopantothenoylcysteine synthetase/decarboxylase